MGVIPKEIDDVKKLENFDFSVKHAPDIIQPKVKKTKEEEVGPVPIDERWIDMEIKTWVEFNKKVLKTDEDKLIVVMYKAKWCRACKQMKQVMKQFQRKYGEDITFGGVDFNYNKETCRNQNVTSLPTFIYYKAGKEVYRVSGMKKKELKAEMISHK